MVLVIRTLLVTLSVTLLTNYPLVQAVINLTILVSYVLYLVAFNPCRKLILQVVLVMSEIPTIVAYTSALALSIMDYNNSFDFDIRG